MKKYALQLVLFSGLFFFSLVSANYDQAEFIEFASNEVFIPERLGNIKLYKDYDGFHIFKDGEIYDIQNCFCDPLLRKMSDEQLVNFLGRNKPKIIILTPEEFSQIDPEHIVEITEAESEKILSQLFSSGYISVNQMDDGEYIIRAKMRLLGGVEVTAGGAAAAVSGVGIGGAAAAGAANGAAAVAFGGQTVFIHAVFGGFEALGPTVSGAVMSLGGGCGSLATLGGAVAAASSVVVPVAIFAGLTYVGVRGLQWLTRSPEEPAANQPANPPAPVAAPDEENPAPQATPAASPRIHEDGW